MIFVDEANFDEEVLFSDIPVLLEFWSTECIACEKANPYIVELENCYKIKVVKIDSSVVTKKVVEYGITKLPTFIIFDRGKIIARIEGLLNKYQIEKELRDVQK